MTLFKSDFVRHSDLEETEAAPQQRPELSAVESFGSNPGDLDMHIYEPLARAKRCPCVIVLHGCTQTALGYDAASGWSRLADEHGFILLYPEQKRSNNEKTCFSWFRPNDVSRGGGEAESIRQMLEWAVQERNVDPANVFVCGLSAGGAMAGALLAAYPELFVAGAIIAGLPYGAATNVSEALDAMFVGRTGDANKWGDKVRAASPHLGPWPRVSIWYGTEDAVVRPINAGELVKQWTNVHGVGAEHPSIDHLGTVTRRIWRDLDGCECVTDYMVPGIGHGTPVDDRSPPAPFFIPAGISATRQIAEDFGLLARRKPSRLLSLIGVGA